METTTLVTLSINGHTVSVPTGTSVIAAAQQASQTVPHFCWHPGLSVAGVCRFCMVKIEGMPKLQIACNTLVAEGMKVDTLSAEVKDAHKWALEFHLINHPLDCPICDQAGECELQNNYMSVGQYRSQMEEKKVLKPKALDVGDTLILDTERCILCSRCVRFEDEVTKTSSLGIFKRGDSATIGTYADRKITHNYSYNLADICPVGAFTSKDFRFKCRVWFLSETKTVCPGCSTGCNVTLFQNKNQREYYRLKPRVNHNVNGHWMCDTGRHMHEHLNVSNRLVHPLVAGKTAGWADVSKTLKDALDEVASAAQSISVVLCPQYTNEEFDHLFGYLKAKYASDSLRLFVWNDGISDNFDGILLRGDSHPNTNGLRNALAKHGLNATDLNQDFSALGAAQSRMVLVFGPERQAAYPRFDANIESIKKQVENASVVYFGTSKSPVLDTIWMRLPAKVFAEKSGSFTNFKGIVQSWKANAPALSTVRSLTEIFETAAYH